MTELFELRCQECGASLNSGLVCPYCGTRYARKHSPESGSLYIQTCPAQIRRVKCEVLIDDDLLRNSPEVAGDMALKELRNQLADELIGLMETETDYKPVTHAQILRGEVRVVEPGFRF